MRVAIYVRVSSHIQAEEGYSIDEQQSRLEAYCKARDWTIVKRYVDPGFSGGKLDRPAIKELMTECEKKLFDLVLVYKLDRLSRSQKDTLYLIEEVFNKHNVGFVSMSENFDTTTSFGKAMIGVLSVFAQLEREQIKERMLMGRLGRAKEGRYHGGTNTPFGYTYVNGELVVNEYEAMMVRLAFKMYNDGVGLNTIGEYMMTHYSTDSKIWEFAGSIHRMLKNKIYIGIIKFSGEEFVGNHIPIIDEDTFNAAQVRFDTIKENLGKRISFKANSLLAGLLFCKRCGARYFRVTQTSSRANCNWNRVIYSCASRSKKNKASIKDPNCKNKNWDMEELDNIVINEIRKLKYDDTFFDKVKADDSVEIDTNLITQKEIENVDKKISKLMDLFALDSMPVELLSKKIQALTEEKEKLESQIVVNPLTPPKMKKSDVLNIVDSIDRIFCACDLHEQREFVNSLIDKILIDGEDVYIHWNF